MVKLEKWGKKYITENKWKRNYRSR
jgi:hypothetical protein